MAQGDMGTDTEAVLTVLGIVNNHIRCYGNDVTNNLSILLLKQRALGRDNDNYTS